MGSNTNRRISLVLIGVLVLTTGCIGGDGIKPTGEGLNVNPKEVESTETGNEILSSSLEATENVETYTVESDSQLTISASFFFGASIPVESEGSFNHRDGIARVDSQGLAEVEAFSFLSNETTYETTVYGTQNTTYSKKEGIGESTDGTGTGSAELVLKQGGINTLPLSLNDTETVYTDTEAQLEGAQTVNGNEAYVLSLDVPPEDVGKHITRVIDVYGPDGITEGNEETEVNETPKEARVEYESYLWVDQETRKPLRFSYYLLLDFEDNEGENMDGVAEFSSETEFGDYGEPLEVDLPDELDK